MWCLKLQCPLYLRYTHARVDNFHVKYQTEHLRSSSSSLQSHVTSGSLLLVYLKKLNWSDEKKLCREKQVQYETYLRGSNFSTVSLLVHCEEINSKVSDKIPPSVLFQITMTVPMQQHFGTILLLSFSASSTLTLCEPCPSQPPLLPMATRCHFLLGCVLWCWISVYLNTLQVVTAM